MKRLIGIWMIMAGILIGGEIDHPVSRDNALFWKGGDLLPYAAVAGAGIAALALPEQDRLRRTLAQSVDGAVYGAVTGEMIKIATDRARPDEGMSPSESWLHARSRLDSSFPSLHTTVSTAVVVPVILEYRHDTPWVYALALFPVYEGISRVKTQNHWQSDVAVGMILGAVCGTVAARQESPLVVQMIAGGAGIGYRAKF